MLPPSLVRIPPTIQIVKIPTVCHAILPMLANNVRPRTESPRNRQAIPIERRERRPSEPVDLVKSHILPVVSPNILLKENESRSKNGLLND